MSPSWVHKFSREPEVKGEPISKSMIWLQSAKILQRGCTPFVCGQRRNVKQDKNPFDPYNPNDVKKTYDFSSLLVHAR